MKQLLLIFILLSTFNGVAQLHVSNGTQFIVYPSTTVTFTSVDTLNIHSGAIFENNGLIQLPQNYWVLENSGFPIFGTGKEKIEFMGNISNEVNPGNLGFHFTTLNNSDTLYLERFHDTLPNENINSIKRYFTLKDELGVSISIHHPKLFADTTETNYPQEMLWHLVGSNISNYINFGTDSSGSMYSINTDTIIGFDFFTLSNINYFVNPNTTFDVCLGETLIIDLQIKGAYPNNTSWKAELSDSNGSFSTITATNNSLLFNQNLQFNFSTTSLVTGANYKIRISVENPEWNFELSNFVIHDLPMTPNIIVDLDSLFIDDFPTGTIQWYLNGNLISGENDSLLIATSNGLYEAEYINSAGCRNTSTYNFNSLSITSLMNIDYNAFIYPNPVNDNFVIENIYSLENVKIYNSIGQEIFQTVLQPGKNVIFTPDAFFAPGLYFIQLNNNVIQFIKE